MNPPVCIGCARTMTRISIGVVVEFRANSLGDKPYQSYQSDLYECRDCGTKVCAGYGNQPTWQHFEGEADRPKPFVSVPEYRPIPPPAFFTMKKQGPGV